MESDATGSVLTRLDDMEKRLAGVDRMTDGSTASARR